MPVLEEIEGIVDWRFPFPKSFEFEGKVFRVGGSSANSMAEMLTEGNIPSTLSHLSYYCEEPYEEITVWFGVLSDASIKAIIARRGGSHSTFLEAEKAYAFLRKHGV